jgi:hypothetical protein
MNRFVLLNALSLTVCLAACGGGDSASSGSTSPPLPGITVANDLVFTSTTTPRVVFNATTPGVASVKANEVFKIVGDANSLAKIADTLVSGSCTTSAKPLNSTTYEAYLTTAPCVRKLTVTKDNLASVITITAVP